MPSLNTSFGGTSFPLDAGTAASTGNLTHADPARRKLIELFEAAINAEMGDAWRAVVGYASGPTGFGSTHKLYGTLPVSDTLELRPTQAHMTQRKARFPLLALHRFGRPLIEAQSLYQDRLTQTWLLHWILGPADTAECHRLLDVAQAIPKLIALIARANGHPAYESGAAQFGTESESGIGGIEVVGAEGPEQAQFAGDENGVIYYALTVEIRTVEYTDPGGEDSLDNFGDFEAADFKVRVGGGEGAIGGLLDFSTDVDDPP